ncbi:Site-specific recombinase XerD [Brevibacterium sandarakinum]|uniref:Site-specific recombinase XerD n=1 Tax=Brevibacterium sandarakinum TaxID=629680 RepID=A0A1H1MVR0_BRESA|nr:MULTISPECIES: tyrosine-type recombinase/integrase [Brevibacterium]RCS91346.1 recombinase XerD [Brevibacterium aurantiacum]SDR90806.1 Site-specific recombinase XerD [Brevibacterium sandarakinum]
MAVRKEPSGRWRAVVKQGRRYVDGATFNTQREAKAWEQRQKAALAGAVDLAARKQPVRSLLLMWIEERKQTVATTTAHTDAAMIQRLSAAFTARAVGSVTDRDVQRVLNTWSGKYAEASVRRFRASLASFFGWCVSERCIESNPVSGSQVPRKDAEPGRMKPLTETELEQVAATIREFDERAADLVLIASWTGLRWSELRAITVADFSRVPVPVLVVRRAAPEGVAVKTTKGRRARTVPVADRVLRLVEACADGKAGDDPLFTSSTGARLHASGFKKAAHWKQSAKARRIHDLRHTAICLWLARGVDAATVQAWAGHASISTTNLYVQHLGTVADRAGLDRLNTPGHTGGTHGEEDGASNANTPGR